MPDSIAKHEYIPLESIASTSQYAPSTISTNSLETHPYISSTPSKILQIQCVGKLFLSAPLPTKELEIPIFDTSTSRPVYLCIRPKRRSGSCHLVLAEDETMKSIVDTTYTFGPFQNPVMRIGVETFELRSKSVFSRTVLFDTAEMGSFEWRYAGKKERAATEMGADNLMVLERSGSKVAALVRGEGSRSLGSKKRSWGNGGRLEIYLDGSEDNSEELEALIVATCLLMLKKEVDRLRGLQIAAMSAHGGGP